MLVHYETFASKFGLSLGGRTLAAPSGVHAFTQSRGMKCWVVNLSRFTGFDAEPAGFSGPTGDPAQPLVQWLLMAACREQQRGKATFTLRVLPYF